VTDLPLRVPDTEQLTPAQHATRLYREMLASLRRVREMERKLADVAGNSTLEEITVGQLNRAVAKTTMLAQLYLVERYVADKGSQIAT
jgi:hypothetical protein